MKNLLALFFITISLCAGAQTKSKSKPFINITLKDTLGKTHQLKDVIAASKYTLVVFYNPDCSHCIETLPKLIPIWEQYRSKSFNVFTVAPKSEKAPWIDFIKKHTGTGWINVINETNNYFGEYAIKTLPSFLLMDSHGKIVSEMTLETVQTDLQKWLDTH